MRRLLGTAFFVCVAGGVAYWAYLNGYFGDGSLTEFNKDIATEFDLETDDYGRIQLFTSEKLILERLETTKDAREETGGRLQKTVEKVRDIIEIARWTPVLCLHTDYGSDLLIGLDSDIYVEFSNSYSGYYHLGVDTIEVYSSVEDYQSKSNAMSYEVAYGNPHLLVDLKDLNKLTERRRQAEGMELPQ